MPKIKIEEGSAVFRYNDIGNNGSPYFDRSGRGLKIYRWTVDCDCDNPKFATVVNKDNMSQCQTTQVCYNPIIKTTINMKKNNGTYTNDNAYSYSNAEYLRRKCRIYERNMPTRTAADGTVYGDCVEITPACSITYKPNNAKFSTQGAVSASERLVRLKYNAIAGDINDNSQCCRRYMGESTPNVDIRKKPQICTRFNRQNKTIC